jgi:hypothetical protein
MNSFTLFLEGADVFEDGHTDALFDAGCNDAVFGERDGAQYAVFDREAESFGAALASAIDQVTSAVSGLTVVRVEPDELVSMAAIAERVCLSREQVRLLSLGKRGPGGFPAPVSYVDRRTRVWLWPEVARWFRKNGKANTEMGEGGDLVAALNAALALRGHAAHLQDDDDLVLVRRALADLPQVVRRASA